MHTTNTVCVDVSNREQLRAWDGGEGAYWAAHADSFDRSVAPYHQRLMATAAITARERVLDIGCGTGQTTRDAARAAWDGSALGVDLSSRMPTHARRRAADEALKNVSFEQTDAQIHPFDAGSFDVAVSRTGAMFFGDLTAAFTNFGRAHQFTLGLMAWMLEGLDADGRARGIDALRATMANHVSAAGVTFESAAWTIQAVRA